VLPSVCIYHPDVLYKYIDKYVYVDRKQRDASVTIKGVAVVPNPC